MINNLPTTPGQHWFKEEGTDNWQPYYVTTLDGEGLICHFSEYNVTSRCLVSEMPGGQWAKAHKPDEGIDAWAVFAPNGNPMIIAMTEQEVINETGSPQPKAWEALQCHGFTCEPVTICRKEKE